jgi:2-dehydropantoate 2-reductase
MKLKVCIVGLGAVGGVIAGRLARLVPPPAAAARGIQIELSALARGATLQAVQRDGLTLIEAEGAHRCTPTVNEDPAALGVQDVVVVALKGPALTAAAPAIAALCGAHTAVLVAMNGLPWWFLDRLESPHRGLQLAAADADGSIRQWLPTERVIGAVVHFNAQVPGPGRVRLVGGNGLILGLPGGVAVPGEPGSLQLQAAADALEAAGFATTRAACIERDIWFKLWGNMTLNPVSALTGATADRILDDELLRGFVSAVMREAQALGAAIGLPIEQTPEERHTVTRRLGAFKTSMLQDLEAGRPLEIDALLGTVHELARRVGQPTPQLDALLGLVRALGRSRGLYPPG